MNVQDVSALPPAEEVLAPGLGPLELLAVDQCRALFEAALGRRCDRRAVEEVAFDVGGEAMNRVTFGHGGTLTPRPDLRSGRPTSQVGPLAHAMSHLVATSA